MKFNPDIHHRRSIRLPGYDYSQPGAYFVTICIWQRECLLGEIQEGNILLNSYGQIVNFNWFNLMKVYPHIELDSFVIMPNHIHGIILIKDRDQNCSLSEIVRGFKTFSARRINQLRSVSGIPVYLYGKGVIMNILFVMKLHYRKFRNTLSIIPIIGKPMKCTHVKNSTIPRKSILN